MEKTGRDYYDGMYKTDIEFQANWLKFGAQGKADSVQELCDSLNYSPSSVIEVGAGTGAVIAELRTRRIGLQHIALDYSIDALEHLKKTYPEIEILHGDITKPFVRKDYDLLVCSHVLEHLEEPQIALTGIRQNLNATYYIFEVPLEDLPLGRVRNNGSYRISNPAGHVQFFNPKSFRNLISTEFEIVSERIYYPMQSAEAFTFVMDKDNVHGIKRTARWLTRRFLPSVLGLAWTSLWHAHMAIVAKRKPTKA